MKTEQIPNVIGAICIVNLFLAFVFTNPNAIEAKMENGAKLKVSSSAFQSGGMIPAKYTCTGENINPALEISGAPAKAKCYAIIMDDPDAPNGTFTHWIAWNIPTDGMILESINPGVSGVNGAGKSGYMGPCPPSGTHRYFFKVYALNSMLTLPETSKRDALEKAMKTHIIGEGQLMGKFSK